MSASELESQARADQPREKPLGEADRLACLVRDGTIRQSKVRAVQEIECFGKRRDAQRSVVERPLRAKIEAGICRKPYMIPLVA